MRRSLRRMLAAGWLLAGVTGLPAVCLAATASATTADHAKFKQLQGEFRSGPAVTQVCLGCHTEAAKQVQHTKHWTWEFLNPESKQRLGKKNVLNNFCISIPSNYPYCTSCHAGYGWKDADFDFTAQDKVDCLVCHDTTGAYRKAPGLAGDPAPGVDLGAAARKVGKSSRDTCGACHFFGGGGDGVKHGDMDSSLAAPDRSLDVHMDATGLDFGCATCHQTASHEVPGSRYTPTAVDREGARMRGKGSKGNPATCVACHDNAPHRAQARLNEHARKIACQTCHIPTIARGGVATKLGWDWSTAGRLDADGKPLVVKDEKGHVVYDSRKGDFTLGENVVPEYAWFNGDVRYTLLGDKVAPAGSVTKINALGGSPTDGRSMIWPLKVFRGVQPYDRGNQTLVTPHTAGTDEAAYWKHFGWDAAIKAGMQDSGAPFSGEIGFIKTEMSWPVTHMVAPKDKALGCADCHREGGRLAGIEGVYMPARDRQPVIEAGGWTLVALTLAGVLGHGVLRVVRGRKTAQGAKP